MLTVEKYIYIQTKTVCNTQLHKDDLDQWDIWAITQREVYKRPLLKQHKHYTRYILKQKKSSQFKCEICFS